MEPVYFQTSSKWRSWLAEHGETETEVWVALCKKGSQKTGVSYDEVLEEALCFGWIDGLTKRVDDDFYKMRFSPRKPKGNWSAPNIKRVAELVKNGKMMPAGLKTIEAAKSNGRWSVQP